MPSYLHELLLLLFRNRTASAADLLRELDVQLPEYDEVRVASSDLNDIRPAEYRADLVLILARESRDLLGIIVEVQLGCDEDKLFAWPAYIANLRARHRCPVCLLVITVEEVVARWAGRSIELGPGTRCRPWVIGPSNMPAVTGLQDAKENVELAILSAIEHAQNPDIQLVARIISTAIVASADIDAERSKLYLDLISLKAPYALEDTMNSLGFEYQSDFARRYIAQGRAEGRMEGRVEVVLQLLASRFGPLPEKIQTCVRGAQDVQLNAVADRILTVKTLEEALGPLC